MTLQCVSSELVFGSFKIDLSKKPAYKAGVPFVDHYCMAAGCTAWGSHGLRGDVWFCPDHIAPAKALLLRTRGEISPEHLLPQPARARHLHREQALKKDQRTLL